MSFIRMICDGGGQFGFGNLRRSASLAAGFQQAGHVVSLEAISTQAQPLLPKPGGLRLDGGNADLWLIDLPYAGDEWVRDARSADRPVVALDFLGTLSPDLTISVFDHGRPITGRHLVGLQYAIIRQDVMALAPAAVGQGVVIVVGGGDEAGLGETIAEHVADFGYKVTLVEGPLSKRTRELPASVARLSSPPDLAAIMSECSWGITTGGGTMLEMMCLGKAVHVVPRTSAEHALANSIFAQGGILGVGLENLRIPTVEAMTAAATAARRLLDGQGISRIVQATEQLLE